MRIYSWLIIVAVISGCANPQTRGEFKEVVAGSPTLGLHGTHTTSRKMADVVKTLNTRWNECFAVTKEMTRIQNGITTMSLRDTYHVEFEKRSESLAELTLLETTHNVLEINGRKGGNFVAALDIERTAANKTKLTWYSPAYGWGVGWERTKEWSDGKNSPCPSEG